MRVSMAGTDKKRTCMSNLALRVSLVSIVVNGVLTVLKLAAGFAAGSGAMVSDAVHSASDVFSTFVVLAGIAASGKKSDKEHPYGHERMECIAAVVLAAVLFETGVGIGAGGAAKLFGKASAALEIPGKIAIYAALLSIAVKEWMFWYTRSAGVRLNSTALKADAWHHRTDAMSSVASLIGVWGARMGFPFMDPAASVVICAFILKAALEIFKDAADKMVDKSCDEGTVEHIREIVSACRGVWGIDEIRTRIFGPKIFVDIEIRADENLKLKDSHAIAQNVHDTVEETFPEVKHCMVHVNPAAADSEKESSE